MATQQTRHLPTSREKNNIRDFFDVITDVIHINEIILTGNWAPVAEDWAHKRSFYFYNCTGKLSHGQPIAFHPNLDFIAGSGRNFEFLRLF